MIMCRNAWILVAFAPFLTAVQCLQPLPDHGDRVPSTTSERVTLATNRGNIVIELFSDLSPNASASFRQLLANGVLDDAIFTDAYPGEFIQGGDYDVSLEPIGSQPLNRDPYNGLKNIRGRVSLILPSAGTSQGAPVFFINVGNNPQLDPEDDEEPDSLVIGHVVEGMDIVDAIASTPTRQSTARDGQSLPALPTVPVMVNNPEFNGSYNPTENLPPAIVLKHNFPAIVPGLALTLDASQTTDPDGDEMTFTWEQTGGPAVELTADTGTTTGFTVPDEPDANVTLLLQVVDTDGNTSEKEVDLFITDAPVVQLQMADGSTLDIDILLQEAPNTSLNFLQYVADGFYDGTIFHRLIPDFVLQGGSFLPGMISQEPVRDPIVNEFDPSRSNVRGTVAMAKVGGDPDSATSGFFFNLVDNSGNLDNQNGGFTVFGRVPDEDLSVMDALADAETDADDVPVEDILIERALITYSGQDIDDDNERVTLATNRGNIVIELFSDLAPNATASFRENLENGVLDNTIFSEAVPEGYIVGGGHDLSVGIKDDLPREPDPDNGLKNTRGRVSVVYLPEDVTQAVPAFIINVGTNPDLDPPPGEQEIAFLVIGQVVEGMDVVDAIAATETEEGIDRNDAVMPYLPVVPITVNMPEFDGTDYLNAPVLVLDDGRENHPAVVPGLRVTLDASGSSHPDGDELTFTWEEDASVVPVELSSETDPITSFTVADYPGMIIRLKLTVTDSYGIKSSRIFTYDITDQPHVELRTADGRRLDVTIFFKEFPNTSLNYLQYVADGFYDGTIIHRAMPGYVLGGGIYLPGLIAREPVRDPVANEFDPSRSNLRGTLAMATVDDDPDSATSGFFFNLADNSNEFDNLNPVIGRVPDAEFWILDLITDVETSTQETGDGVMLDDVPVEDVVISRAIINYSGQVFE